MKKQVMTLCIAAIVMLVVFWIACTNDSLSSQEGIDLAEFSHEKTTVEEISEGEEEIDLIPSCIVDVKGEVMNPGVYEVDDSFRVHDVILQAGGFLETANANAINLAQKVSDEMVIYVPNLEETSDVVDLNSWNNSSQPSKVSINRATEEELQTLSGIGPSKAAAIIKYRTENGTFESIEELTKVNGIGTKTLENLREDIEL